MMLHEVKGQNNIEFIHFGGDFEVIFCTKAQKLHDLNDFDS